MAATGRVEGKVALITGAARGQGRSHALRLAEEGADIIAVDICANIPGLPYAGPSDDDLADTADGVEAFDRRVVTAKADVRDFASLKAAVAEGVSQLGSLDIVCANAGIGSFPYLAHEMPNDIWRDMIDIIFRVCGTRQRWRFLMS